MRGPKRRRVRCRRDHDAWFAGIVGATFLLCTDPRLSTLILFMAIAGIPCELVIVLRSC